MRPAHQGPGARGPPRPRPAATCRRSPPDGTRVDARTAGRSSPVPPGSAAPPRRVRLASAGPPAARRPGAALARRRAHRRRRPPGGSRRPRAAVLGSVARDSARYLPADAVRGKEPPRAADRRPPARSPRGAPPRRPAAAPVQAPLGRRPDARAARWWVVLVVAGVVWPAGADVRGCSDASAVGAGQPRLVDAARARRSTGSSPAGDRPVPRRADHEAVGAADGQHASRRTSARGGSARRRRWRAGSRCGHRAPSTCCREPPAVIRSL